MKKNKFFQLVSIIIILIIVITIIAEIIHFFVNNHIEMSEKEAIQLLDEKYETAVRIYELSTNYFEIENVSDIEENWYYYKIKNFNEVLDKHFSKQMKEEFINDSKNLKKINNIYYIVEGDISFSQYNHIEFKDIFIEKNYIQANVDVTLIDNKGNEDRHQINSFKLIKENDNWLIDDYTNI